jgi:hypothetical protein
MMKMTTFAIGLGLAAQVSMGQTFLHSNGNTLFRTTINGGGTMTDTFTLGADLTSLAVNPTTGEIFGAARTDSDGDGMYELYQLNNATGTPSLSLVGDFLAQNTPSLSFVDNGRLLGFQQEPAVDENSALVEIDLNMLTQTTIDTDLGFDHQASGYDPSSGTLFANSNDSPASFFSVPFNDMDVMSQLIGPTGQATINNGGEFFNGTYYHVVHEFNVGQVLGSINTATGEFTPILTIDVNNDFGPVGLAVIPTPGAAALAGIAGLAGLRRRR